ncbi:MAG: aldo/keto reductase [Gammaproteobacteria bacterium]|nr:aldo/keto reductase [Gammaproteobacteria bacterium]
MKKNHLVSADFFLTALGLGGAALGNLYQAISDDVAAETILAAWASGIRYFDTAPHYGCGLSERRLGKVLKQFPRHDYVLSTKVGRLLRPGVSTEKSIFENALPFYEVFDYSYDGIMRSFEESVQRLQTTYIDILLIHDLGQLTHKDQHDFHLLEFLDSGYRALAELRDQQCVRAIGLGVNEWEICVEIFPHVELNCVMLAGRYTLLDRSTPQHFFDQCVAKNISLIIAGPYNSGILAGGRHFEYAEPSSDIKKRVNQLKILCSAHAVDLPHAALQFPLQHPSVVSVVAGAKSSEEIEQAARYIKQPIKAFFAQ